MSRNSRAIHLHLISAPWTRANQPSIQLASLKAFISQTFGKRVCVRTYSAFFSIIYEVRNDVFHFSFDEKLLHEEIPYLLLYYRKFLKPELNRPGDKSFERLVKSLSKLRQIPSLTLEFLNSLEKSTIRYVDERLMSNLQVGVVNVVGFTLTYSQMYSSLFIEKLVRDRLTSKQKVIFLYGGHGAASPLRLDLMIRLGSKGFCIPGEGEPKLKALIEYLLGEPEFASVSERELESMGISRPHRVAATSMPLPKNQISDLTQLPLPDYSDYFEEVRNLLKRDSFNRDYQGYAISLEGSRGCFAHCDFCTLNTVWRGFRKSPPELVYDRAIQAMDRYCPGFVLFADTVADTWAEKFADLMLKNKRSFPFFMELRAHHPEKFWTKLKMVGLTQVVIGVETLSAHLLKEIGKGTTVSQNILAQKYLSELGVESNSNLIVYHPKSNVEDVKVTKSILEAIPHFPPFFTTEFWLDAGSPIYEMIPSKVREKLKSDGRHQLISSPHDYLIDIFSYELPKNLRLDKKTRLAWETFLRWYRGTYLPKTRCSTLKVIRKKGGRLQIVDGRGKKVKKYLLEAERAAIYDLGHSGPKREQLYRMFHDAKKVDSALKFFKTKKLMIEEDGFLISLAFRPKEELEAKISHSLELETSLDTNDKDAASSPHPLTGPSESRL